MIQYCYKLFLRLFAINIITINVTAQVNDSLDVSHSKKNVNIFSIGAGIQHGFIFAHSRSVQNTKGANPTGVELSFGWQRNDTETWDLCNCFPKKGLLLFYYDYDVDILGRGVGAAYFLEPYYKLGNKTFFSFRGVAGLAYLTNPFDSVHNPTNQSYSSAIGGYLLLGIGFSYLINKQWWLNTTINYQHISNGGLRQPNKGINWPTAGFSVIYQENPRPYYKAPRSKVKFWKGLSPRWDVGVFGIAKRGTDENGNSYRMPLIGGTMQVARQVGRINMLTLGAEVYGDKSLRMQLKRDSIDASAIRAGLLIGHEFLLGKFVFSQRLGVYIFNQTPYYDPVYHRWGIQYFINKHLGIGMQLKAHRHVADFVDLRLTYSWQKSR
ncbi:MAG TPA: acyloxyacyl hydrolase [Chitinophagaceae bacterium]|nr:acyloxyacyl hydrolase [Chitinophagaceae bacterium]